MGNLSRLKDLIFCTDNNACFIEKERIVFRLEKEMADYEGKDKYAIIFSKLMSGVSTPIDDSDYFGGRVVEDFPDEGMNVPCWLLFSEGHMSPDYEKVLKMGLSGILSEIKENALKKGDEASHSFSHNAEIVVTAIKDYTDRYAASAREKGFDEMAKALSTVPFEPAYDYYSALQSIWIIHMIASAYVGARDYAFGKFDKYMLPFYQKALKDGATEDELTELLAGFFVKANEICGRNPHNYNTKNVLCQSSKQYVNIGGETPNEFSKVVLKAAKLNNMAQPTIIVMLKPEADTEFTDMVFDALHLLHDKMSIYNYNLILPMLLKKGIPYEVASDFTYSACSTFDLNYHTFRMEHFAPTPEIFLEVLNKKDYHSVDEILKEYTKSVNYNLQIIVDNMQKGYPEEEARRRFVLDSILLSDSAVECRYACDGKAKYNVLNLFCPGIATIGDSLMVLDKLVFKEKRFAYKEFMNIVNSDFEGYEELRQEILSYTMFGNDTKNDTYTRLAGDAFIDAVDTLELKSNFYAIPGFYSLDRDNVWKDNVGATPNGRKHGEPFSENQSPTYGADKNGITALLKSLSKLPFDRTATGALNLTFSENISAKILKSLTLSYFELGGLHVAITIIDRETLKDAMVNPDKYKSLTVRLYGFSEYFVNLPEWQQLAILNRTEYNE